MKSSFKGSDNDADEGKATELKKFLEQLPLKELETLQNDWQIWARDDQLPPSHLIEDHTKAGEQAWNIWLLLGGRGAGKTRAGAEWVRAMALGIKPIATEPAKRIALVGETLGDVRRTMIEGISGLLEIHPPEERPLFEPSKRRITWPNGSIAEMYSAEDPESLRGPQFMAAWCDEICKWPHATETWDMLQFALRLGEAPRQVVTTTPRSTALLKAIIANDKTVIQRSRTQDNSANLSASFLKTVEEKYGGTRLGRQELDGELIEDREDALWQRDQIEKLRIRKTPELERIVVAIDPPVTSGEKADLCGIVAAGINHEGQGFILKDKSVKRATPLKWAQIAVDLFHDMQADRIVAEVNQGGDLVETILRQIDETVPIRKVHASRGKYLRAEPVAALYEQGRISHVGCYEELEDQMCDFGPGGLSNGKSPDRLDALVWAMTDLMLNTKVTPRMRRL
ncbi:terminase family protein [Hyphomicrobiales bacterium 4NK60-0047b]